MNAFPMNRIKWMGAALATALWLLPSAAFAAQTGELQGYVVDIEGAPLAGVEVTLTSPQLIGDAKKAVTGPEGDFRFGQLDPGDYTVTLTHPSFIPYTEEKIAVGIDQVVIRDYLLEPKGEGGADDKPKEVRVIAKAPVLDTTSTSTGTSMTPERTDYIPTGRSYQGMALFSPGVVNSASAGGNPSVHGGSPYGNQYMLDGINITDPVTNTFSTNFNFDSIAETQVLTSGFDAEYGHASGGIINVVTKSGGDEFSLDGSVLWGPSQLQLLDPGEKNDSNTIDVNLAVGGPILKKRLWFFLSGQYLDSVSETPLVEPLFVDPNTGDVLVDRIPPYSYRHIALLGKLKWQPLDWQKLTLVMQADPTWISNEQQAANIHPDAERQRFQGGIHMGLTSETILGENLFWKTQLGYGLNRLQIFPGSGDFDTPGHENIATGTSTVNDSEDFDNYRYRLQLHSSISYFLEGFLGDHEFKGGIDGQISWETVYESYPGGAIFTDNGINQSGSSIDGVGDPFQKKVLIEPVDKLIWGNTISLFVQDVWRPFRNLTVRPGVRFDSARAYNDVKDGGREIYNFNYLSPRLGVAWDPFGDGKTVLRAGYYQYAETGMLFLAEAIGRSLTADVYEYNPATGEYDRFVRREGGEDSIIVKEGMKPPLTHEVVLGVERELFENSAIGVHAIFRRLNNMYEDDEVNVQWNKDGTNATGFNNGKAEYIFSLGTPDEAFRQYAGLEVKFDKRLSDNWQMLASYTFSRTTGTTNTFFTEAFDNPRQRKYEFGFLEDDITHVGRLSASYTLPFGITIGGTGIYQSGRPYDKLFLNDFYGAYYNRKAPRGCDPDTELEEGETLTIDNCKQLRLPDRFTLNARVVWSLKELTTQDIWLIADVFNVLNSRPITAVESRFIGDGSTFEKPLSRGGPLNAQVGLRYKF